jgi:hypothetical protein
MSASTRASTHPVSIFIDVEHPMPEAPPDANVTTMTQAATASEVTGQRRQREDELDDGDSSDHERRQKKSRVHTLTWSYSRPLKASETVRDKHYHEIWYCKHCDQYKTTNLKRAREHLRTKHRIYVKEEQSDNLKRQKGTIEDIVGKQIQRQEGRDIEQEKHLLNAINKPAFQEAMARLITVCSLPHSLIERGEFHAVILSLNHMAKDVLIQSRHSIPKLIKNTFDLHQEALCKKLHQSLSQIHFSIDMWTASDAKTAYQAIVTHFVDSDTNESATALISMREFKAGHGGEDQAKVFLEVMDQYELRGRIGFFTMDNADSNDSMLRYLSNEIAGFDPVYRRLRCNGHVINLAVQAFLFRSNTRQISNDESEAIDEAINEAGSLSRGEQEGRIDREAAAREWRNFGVLGQLHNLVIFSRASSSRLADFKQKIGRAIPLDNDTRWNSWYTMIGTALEKKELMSWIGDNYEHFPNDALSHANWQELKDIHEFLHPFFRVSKRQGRESTLDEVLSHMDFLIHHYQQAKQKHRRNAHFSARLLASWYKFDKYYKLTDDTPIYAAAILLHPALRRGYLDRQWEKQASYIEPAIDSVRNVWKEFKTPIVPVEPSVRRERDEFERWRQQIYHSSSNQDEFERFINASYSVIFLLLYIHGLIFSLLKIKAEPVSIGSSSALTWWLQESQQTSFPSLSKLALNIFSIPPMSTEPERVFSGARRTISWDRTRLGSQMVEYSECLKSWVSVPMGKRRPLLAGVFRSAEEVDKACGIPAAVDTAELEEVV